MRVIVLVKATPESEAADFRPAKKDLEEMGAFNEELAKAGVMLAAEGLQSSAAGKRVHFDAEGSSVIDGPFAEAKELVAGFWIWDVRSMDEAVEWLKRAPFRDAEVELRPIFEADEFDDVIAAE